jgi:hypothetical protein
MRPRSPLAGSIDLTLDLDLATDPVGSRTGGAHLRLLPPLPPVSPVPAAQGPEHDGPLGDTPLR